MKKLLALLLFSSLAISQEKIQLDPQIQFLKEAMDTISSYYSYGANMRGFQRSDNKSQPNSLAEFTLDFSVIRNKKFKGFLTNLDGSIYIDKSITPKVLIIYDEDIGEDYCSDNTRSTECVEELLQSAKVSYKYRKLDSEDGLFQTRFIFKNLYDLGVHQELHSKLQGNLTDFLFEVIDSHALFNDQMKEIGKFYVTANWIWNAHGNTARYCFTEEWLEKNYDLTEFAYIMAPQGCLYNQKEMGDDYYPRVLDGFEGDYSVNVETVNYFEFILNDWKKIYIEKLENIIKIYLNDANKGYVVTKINDGANLCALEVDTNNSDVLVKSTKPFFDNNYESVVANTTFYADSNLLYRGLQSNACGYVALNLSNFLQISSLEDNLPTNYFNFNLKSIQQFFTKSEALALYKKTYSGLSPKEIREYESVTGLKVYLKDLKYFIKTKQLFLDAQVPFRKDSYDLFSEISNEIYGNSYLSSINYVLESYINFIKAGVDITDASVLESISSEVNKVNIKFDNSGGALIYYSRLALALHQNNNEGNVLVKLKRLINNFVIVADSKLAYNNNIARLVEFYLKEQPVATSAEISFEQHMKELIEKAELRKKEAALAKQREEARQEREEARQEREEAQKEAQSERERKLKQYGSGTLRSQFYNCVELVRRTTGADLPFARHFCTGDTGYDWASSGDI